MCPPLLTGAPLAVRGVGVAVGKLAGVGEVLVRGGQVSPEDPGTGRGPAAKGAAHSHRGLGLRAVRRLPLQHLQVFELKGGEGRRLSVDRAWGVPKEDIEGPAPVLCAASHSRI